MFNEYFYAKNAKTFRHSTGKLFEMWWFIKKLLGFYFTSQIPVDDIYNAVRTQCESDRPKEEFDRAIGEAVNLGLAAHRNTLEYKGVLMNEDADEAGPSDCYGRNRRGGRPSTCSNGRWITVGEYVNTTRLLVTKEHTNKAHTHISMTETLSCLVHIPPIRLQIYSAIPEAHLQSTHKRFSLTL
uniref:Uncharacterized protein n=1 Tax=Glossina pallidipes TaxID=7398 RepID=A0A1B0AE79_GLOPL